MGEMYVLVYKTEQNQSIAFNLADIVYLILSYSSLVKYDLPR